MLGLPQLVEIEIEYRHQCQHDEREDSIDHQPQTHCAAYPVMVSANIHRTYQRRQSIGKAKYCHNGNVEGIVDKRGRGEGIGRIMPHHYIVGKAHGNIAQLAKQQRESQSEYRLVTSCIIAKKL